MGTWANSASLLLAEIWRALGPATEPAPHPSPSPVPAAGAVAAVGEAVVEAAAAVDVEAAVEAAAEAAVRPDPRPHTRGAARHTHVSLGACYCYCPREQGIGRCFDVGVTEVQCHSRAAPACTSTDIGQCITNCNSVQFGTFKLAPTVVICDVF